MKGQWGKLTGYVIATGVVSAALTFLTPLIGGGSWLPDRISSEGKSIDALFWGLLWLSVVIFALVLGVVTYAMVHFRAAPGDMSDGEHIHGNARMELAWIVVPSIIVFVVGWISYVVLQDNEIGLYDEAAAKDKGAATMAVDVRGFSYGWAFRYTDTEGELLAAGSTPTNELVLPAGQVVRFNVMSCSGKEHLGRIREITQRELEAGDEPSEFAEIEPGICEREWDVTTPDEQQAAEEEATLLHTIAEKRKAGNELSAEEQALHDEQPRFSGDQQFIDVNHAFWVPEARLKIDAVSGLRTYVQWQTTRVTTPDDRYQVVCAELCGTGHNGMRTDMCVVDQATFDWWVELSEEDRRDATCANLRLLSCVQNVSDRDGAIAKMAKLSKADPEAECTDAQEKI